MGKIPYDKPHRYYDQQLSLMESRGLLVNNRKEAIQALKGIGYYRFSAYTYVFRKHDPTTSELSIGRRLDEFVDGSCFSDALLLYRFDEKLRSKIFEGLLALEIGLRVRIGYQLGKTNPWAHLNVEFLDDHRANEVIQRSDDKCEKTKFDLWKETCEKSISDARHEDFVKHFNHRYLDPLPIWVVTEVLSFGALVRLFELLRRNDAQKIAKEFAIPNSRLLWKYLHPLTVLRNHCAHGGRIWNRKTVFAPPIVKDAGQIPDTLLHLKSVSNERLYFLCALIVHCVTVVDPATNWPRSFATLVKKAKLPSSIDVLAAMGFPPNWDQEALWKYDPQKS
ncbi:abortive infection bacteriophage resistance protein [Arcanobacterium pluranimalium]|uniref:Abi family protein n=1 Tax=Arcanobacterium pluranimalium TaxID=108028 RepID=UPI00195D7799|nr:Abi family protein [Arcanobacterium pluranimalium]MBM7824725.1 abortive infection bacteriophage resistance protein [Arcanobacterium pluranimalium]